MALPGVVVKIAGEAKSAITAIDKVGDELLQLPGQAAKAAQGVGRHASDMAGSIRRSGDDVRKTGDDYESSGGKGKKAFDTMGDSAIGASSQIGEAFGSGGKASQALGGLGEVVESFAGMFGPIGLAVGAAGGVIIGALAGVFGKAEQMTEELKQKALAITDELIEKQGQLDEEYKQSTLEDFVKDNLDYVKVLRDQIGPRGLPLLKEALSGNAQAYDELTGMIDDSESALQAEYDTLKKRTSAGERLTDEEIRRRDALPGLMKAMDEVKGKTEDEIGAVDRAYDAYNLLKDARRNNLDAMNDTYDKQYKITSRLYDEAEAAKVAKENTERLAYARAQTPPPAPKGAVAYDVNRKVWLDAQGRTIAAKQAGGPVSAGHAYLVGESGPEVIVPAQSGTVIPNQAVGAGALTVHMHLHAAVATPDVIREAAPIVTRALVDAQRRAGMRTPGNVYTSMGA